MRRAAGDLVLDLGQSVMVGDRWSDVEAANAAGLRKAFLLGGGDEVCDGEYLRVRSLAEVAAWLEAEALETTGGKQWKG